MKTDGRDHELRTGSEGDGNVVQLRREWFGPRENDWFGSPEELVPVGPGAADEAERGDAAESTSGEDSPDEVRDGAGPLRAEHFWDGIADVHDLVQFPAAGALPDQDPARSPAIERRRQRRRVAAAVAIVACGLVGLRTVTAGSGQRPAANGGEKLAGVVDRLDRPSRVHVARQMPVPHRARPRVHHHEAVRHISNVTTQPASSTPVQSVVYSTPAQAAQPTTTEVAGTATGGYGGSGSGSSAGTGASSTGNTSTGTTASHAGPTGKGAPFGPGHMGG